MAYDIPKVEVIWNSWPTSNIHFRFIHCSEVLASEALVRITTKMVENPRLPLIARECRLYLEALAQHVLIDMSLRNEIWQDYQGTWQLEKTIKESPE